jgi:hypothetical protein
MWVAEKSPAEMENGREMRRVDMVKRETSKGSKFALSNGKLEQ